MSSPTNSYCKNGIKDVITLFGHVVVLLGTDPRGTVRGTVKTYYIIVAYLIFLMFH